MYNIYFIYHHKEHSDLLTLYYKPVSNLQHMNASMVDALARARRFFNSNGTLHVESRHRTLLGTVFKIRNLNN